MDGERLHVQARADCLHDEAAACTTVASTRLAAGRAGCTRRWRCCGRRLSQVQRGAPRDKDTIFAQATLRTPVEFNLKCVQLNYLRRTVHGRVDFPLFQSCSLTNISSAAPPPPKSPWPACFHGNTSSDKTTHVMLA